MEMINLGETVTEEDHLLSEDEVNSHSIEVNGFMPIVQDEAINTEKGVNYPRGTHSKWPASTKIKRFVKYCNYAFVFAFILFIMATIFFVAIEIKHSDNVKELQSVCTSKECIKSASNLLEAIDMEIDPCDDFYKFVCNKWKENHLIPDFTSQTDWLKERSFFVLQQIQSVLKQERGISLPASVEKAISLYKSCLKKDDFDAYDFDAHDLDTLEQVLEYTGLPIYPSTNSQNAFTLTPSYPVFINDKLMRKQQVRSNEDKMSAENSWLQTIAAIKRVIGKDVLIGIDVIPHPLNNSINVIQVGRPKLSYPIPSTYEGISYLRTKYLPYWARKQQDENPENGKPQLNKKKRYLYDEDEDNNPDLQFMKNVFTFMKREGENLNGRRYKRQYPLHNNEDNDVNNYIKEIYQESKLLYPLQRLQQYILSITWYNKNETNMPYPFEEMDIHDLQKLTDEALTVFGSSKFLINWELYFKFLLEGINVSSVSNTDKIIVTDNDYLTFLAELLATTEPYILEGIVWWETVSNLVPYSSSDLRDIVKRYKRQIGIQDCYSRKWYCADTTNKMMDMAVSWLLAYEEKSKNKKYSRHENETNTMGITFENVEEMLTTIKESFSDSLNSIDWMDYETKKVAKRKAKKMKGIIGYPSWLMTPGELDNYYEGIAKNDSGYLENLVAIAQIKTAKKLKRKDVTNKNSADVWDISQTTVNAEYSLKNNALNIPAAILEFPFYKLGTLALNYGGIGTIIGHEFMHGFGNDGQKYDENGNWKYSPSDKLIANNTRENDCLIQQYSSYFDEISNSFQSSREMAESTLDENIADIGGLQLAFKAFKRYQWQRKDDIDLRLPGLEQFSQDQLFFISFAYQYCEYNDQEKTESFISHSPSKVRVWGGVSNSEDFSRVFNCSVGSRMNPAVKCKFW